MDQPVLSDRETHTAHGADRFGLDSERSEPLVHVAEFDRGPAFGREGRRG